MSIFVLLELPLEVIMSGHIKWNRVSRGVIISMLLLITMGCGHNMRIENSVEQNTVEIQKVEDHAGTIVLPEGQFYEIIKNNPIDQDYKWEDTGVEDRIERAGKCYQAWCAEIENSLNHLQVYLDSEDYEQLYSAGISLPRLCRWCHIFSTLSILSQILNLRRLFWSAILSRSTDLSTIPC